LLRDHTQSYPRRLDGRRQRTHRQRAVCVRKFSAPKATASTATLYDLLGVHPHDDAERLKDAFRKAVKTLHPDAQADDPDATRQFGVIVDAYATLRHPERRAAYDRLLQLERERLRAMAGRGRIYTTRKFLTDAAAAFVLAFTIAGGFSLFTRASRPTIDPTAPGPTQMAAAAPASPLDASSRKLPQDNLEVTGNNDAAIAPPAVASEMNGGAAPAIADVKPAQSAAERDKLIEELFGPADQAVATTGTGHLEKGQTIDRLDQNRARSAEAELSKPETAKVTPKSAPPEAAAEEKRQVRILNAATHRKLRVATPQSPDDAPLRQASLESGRASTCSDLRPCSGHPAPLLGVGF
jgi:curved DNA-binding protein CbpA